MTEPQKRPATKQQRRLATRQETYDKALSNRNARSGKNGLELMSDLHSRRAIHRPGSNN